jgi:hypothetical protein
VSFEGPFCWAFFYFVFLRIISTTLTFIHNVAATRKKVESFLGLDIAWRISKKMPLWWHSTWRRIAPVRELFFFLSSLWTVKEKELKNIFCYFNSYKKPKAAREERAVFCYSSDVAISWLYTSRLGVYTLESIGSAFYFFYFFMTSFISCCIIRCPRGLRENFQIRFLYTRKISPAVWIPFSCVSTLEFPIFFIFLVIKRRFNNTNCNSLENFRLWICIYTSSWVERE